MKDRKAPANKLDQRRVGQERTFPNVRNQTVSRHATPPVVNTYRPAPKTKPPLVSYERDYVYGTELKFVNGVPISFKKMPETRPVKTNNKKKSSDDGLDEMEGF